MANKIKGESSFSYEATNKKGETFTKELTFSFNNEGVMAAENLSGMEAGEISAKLGVAGARLQRALIWGATRKYHARDFRAPQAVSEFLDHFQTLKDEAEDPEELDLDLSAALIAAWTRQSKEDILKRSRGEIDEDEEDEAPKGAKKKESKDG